MMNKKRVFGIIVYGTGIIMLICNLIFIFIIFFSYFSKEENFSHHLFFFLFGTEFFPTIGTIVSEIAVFIFSLFLIFLGARLLPIIRMTVLSVIMFIFSLFSIILGMNKYFFFSHLALELKAAHLLILLSVFVYIAGGISLVRLKNWARRLILYYSYILVFFFLPLSIYLIPTTPLGGGVILAIAFSAHIIFPLFFIIFLTRPQVKRQFGEMEELRAEQTGKL